MKMEHYKTYKLLNDSTVSKFSTNKNIMFKTSFLRSKLYDYSNGYVVVKGIITVKATENTDIDQKDVAFKKNLSLRSCITETNSTLIDSAIDFKIALPIYNLVEYSHNYFIKSESLWSYYRDNIDDVDANA